MKPKISIITLGVSDFRKSLQFYRDGLGFPPHNYDGKEEIVFFEMEGTWLCLYPKEKIADGANVPTLIPGFGGMVLAHNVKTKQEVDEVINLAVSAGGKVAKKPTEVFWGGYSGYFTDPDGYLWEVAYNPFTDLT